jgi:hypothetical protein
LLAFEACQEPLKFQTATGSAGAQHPFKQSFAQTNIRGGFHLRKLLFAVIAIACAACTETNPTDVSQNRQIILPGTTAILSGGAFTLSSGTLTCNGDYDSLDMSRTISLPIQCSDGRRGIVSATRDTSSSPFGTGTVRLSDGNIGTFTFGPGARGF